MSTSAFAKFTHRNGTTLILRHSDILSIYQMPLAGSDDMVCVIITPHNKFEVQGVVDDLADLLASTEAMLDYTVESEE